MILLDPPLTATWTDGFDGDSLDRRYMPPGPVSGTSSVADGRLTLTLPPGPPDTWVTQGIAWPATGDPAGARVVLHEAVLAEAPALTQVAVLIGVGPSVRDLLGIIDDAGAGRLVALSYNNDVVTERYNAAAPDLPVRLRIARTGVTVRFYMADADGSNEALLAEHTEFVEGPAIAGLVVQSLNAGETVSGVFDDFVVDLPTRIDEASDVMMGCHLRHTMRLRGRAIPGDLLAVVSGPVLDPEDMETCIVRSVAEREAIIVLPSYGRPSQRWLWLLRGELPDDVSFVFAEGLPLVWSDTGYRILRGLLAPGRYTDDPANPFNTMLAALGAQLDRLDAATRDLYLREIVPALASQMLHRWEFIYGIPTNADDPIADRRARVDARSRLAPRITTGYMNSLIDPFLPDVEFEAVSGWDVYGDLVFRGSVHEPSPGALSLKSWGELEQLLNAAGPGWGEFLVGHEGFVLGASTLGRDFW